MCCLCIPGLQFYKAVYIYLLSEKKSALVVDFLIGLYLYFILFIAYIQLFFLYFYLVSIFLSCVTSLPPVQTIPHTFASILYPHKYTFLQSYFFIAYFFHHTFFYHISCTLYFILHLRYNSPFNVVVFFLSFLLASLSFCPNSPSHIFQLPLLTTSFKIIHYSCCMWFGYFFLMYLSSFNLSLPEPSVLTFPNIIAYS